MANESPPAARKPSGGSKAKKPKRLSQKEQSERFIQTAREVGADESGEEFGKVLDYVIPPVPPKPGSG